MSSRIKTSPRNASYSEVNRSEQGSMSFPLRRELWIEIEIAQAQRNESCIRHIKDKKILNFVGEHKKSSEKEFLSWLSQRSREQKISNGIKKVGGTEIMRILSTRHESFSSCISILEPLQQKHTTSHINFENLFRDIKAAAEILFNKPGNSYPLTNIPTSLRPQMLISREIK